MTNASIVNFPKDPSLPHVAVIGAGLSGLACADRLRRRGGTVTLFDKGRAPGGRLSTRRADGLRFDHGAQYFTARTPEFRAQVDEWVATGVVAPWTGRIVRLGAGAGPEVEESVVERFVGTPGMSALGRHLAGPLQPRCGVRVASVTPAEDGWRLTDEHGTDLGTYDRVVAAVPAPQAVPLLAEAPDLAAHAAEAIMTGCWSVMLRFPRRLDLSYDGAFVTSSDLSWIARDGAKPGRSGEETWVLHGSTEWSQRHIEDDSADVVRELTAAFFKATGVAAVAADHAAADHAAAHRWRFSLPFKTLDQDCLYDPARGLGACGDWCIGARVEGAFISGTALADRIMAGIGDRR